MLETLNIIMKESKGEIIFPQIRFFDGDNMFSTSSGQYKSENLEESLRLFLKENIKNIENHYEF